SATVPLKSIDSYFEGNYLVELYNILDANESNAIFAMLVALLSEYRMSQGLQSHLKHLTVLEEAHRIIPSRQAGPGEDRVSSPAYEASTLLAQMLAEIRAYGEGIIIVDQSPSKIIADVLINSSTKLILRTVHGADKECLGAALSLSPQEQDYLSYLNTGEAIASVSGIYQPVHIRIPK
ncbi:MAG: ATP-binding protein, partial [Pseudanabaena sp. SU_2_4]|nr:ATP-binding protein [Pseudanabaena sp. SU_2_4]